MILKMTLAYLASHCRSRGLVPDFADCATIASTKLFHDFYIVLFEIKVEFDADLKLRICPFLGGSRTTSAPSSQWCFNSSRADGGFGSSQSQALDILALHRARRKARFSHLGQKWAPDRLLDLVADIFVLSTSQSRLRSRELRAW